MNRRNFGRQLLIAAGSFLVPRRSVRGEVFDAAPADAPVIDAAPVDDVPVALQKEMYAAALRLVKSKIRGGDGNPIYPHPYLDAAFSTSIYYWDTCLMTSYAKYHLDELPITAALDNFYRLAEPDGFICREYTKDGRPFWPKAHPVSVNPPLLGFAELQLFSKSRDLSRLRSVYPGLRRHFDYLVRTFRMEDGLFFSDAFGSGMDNIPRYPPGWTDDGKGIPIRNLYPEVFTYAGLSPYWNKQGRSVDMSAQMCLFALNLAEIATLTGVGHDVAGYRQFHRETAAAINNHCWSETDQFYYDLGYGQHIRRKHIGMYWTLLAGVVPTSRLDGFIAHLTDPSAFGRKVPIPSVPADSPDFRPEGGYWLGSVWAPTNYAILLGLRKVGRARLADQLARRYYYAVAEVYKRTGTFWENYSPDYLKQGDMARPDFCGWTALVPITLYHEFIHKGSGS